MLDEILKIHQSGRFEEAEQRYREWLAFNPDDPEALHLLAIVRRQREDLAEALEFARRAVEIAPDRGNYQLTLAGLLLHARQLGAAREGFATALRLNAKLAGAALGLGQVALLQNDLEAAAEALGKAERLVPGHPQVFSQKAALAQLRGDHDAAATLYIEAAKLNPNDPAVQANLARSFVVLGKTAFAEQALRNALRLKPTYAMARIALAQLFLREQRLDEALLEFDYVLADRPDHPLALAGRGDIRLGRGDVAGAIVDYRKAREGAPDVPGISSALVRALFIQGLADEARSTLAEALATSPADAELRRLDVGDAGNGSAQEHLDACRRWLAAAPDSIEAQERLATRLESFGQHQEADQIARSALARDSRAVFARLLLARSALRDDQPDAAQEQLNRLPDAILSVPDRIDRALLRGLARDRLGDLAGAVEAWLTGHRLQPGLAPPVPLPGDPGRLPRPLTAGPPADPGAQGPTFLLALPGAGSHSLVALLRNSGLNVLPDRFGRRVRPDAVATGEYVALFERAATDAAATQAFRDSYLAGLAGAGEALAPDLVDWLPFADARLLLLVEAAFPTARYLVLQRDPRDCLLTWLAMGSPQALAFTDAAETGSWLIGAHCHLRTAMDVIPASRQLRIDSAALADPAAVLAQTCAFLGCAPGNLDDVPDTVIRGRGGVPTMLPDGRWQAYVEVLAPALTPMSAAIGDWA